MKVLFTLLYFYCFFQITDWFVTYLSPPLSAKTDLLCLFALFLLLVLSIGLAEFTAEKIKKTQTHITASLTIMFVRCPVGTHPLPFS